MIWSDVVLETISSAIRQNKLYKGKDVEVGEDPKLLYLAEVASVTIEEIVLKLLNSHYNHELFSRAKDICVRFVIPEDASYIFMAAVAGYDEKDCMLTLRNLSSLSRVDQRSNFRLKTARSVFLSVENSSGEGEKWSEAVLLDISRGGARILTSAVVQAGDRVKLSLFLTEVEHTMEAVAEVVHAASSDGQFDLGLRFTELPLADLDHLLEFIIKVWLENKSGEL